MRPLRIRGSAALCAFGVERDALTQALARNEPLRARSLPDDSVVLRDRSPGVLAFDVPGFSPEAVLGDKGLRTLDRLTKLLVVAARQAVVHAELKRDGAWSDVAPSDVGICTSNAYGSLEAIHELDRVATLEDPRYINPAKFPNTVSNSASGYVSIWEDLRAFNVTVSNGNPGGLDAFYIAGMHAANGRARHVLVGGGEAMSDALCVAWQRLGLGTKEPNVAPLAESCTYVVVDANHGGGDNRPGVYVTGYGSAFEPKATSSLFVPAPQAMKRAVALALADAKLDGRAIDVVLTGACGIGAFDDAEREGIAHLVSETLGGAGALSVCVASMMLSGEVAFPGAGAPPKHVLITALGFNGNASALVLSRR
jgi:3-oxoacyl-(acyl-carrier-protein) synthase